MNIFKNRKFINFFIIAINVLFVGGLAFSEYQYVHSSKNQTIKANKDSFVSTNTSLSSMTSNYLVGESHLCRSWANYLNNEERDGLTIEDAIYFVEHSITDTDIVAHIIRNSDKKGLSTRGHSSDPNNRVVDLSSSDYFISSVTYTPDTGIKASPEYSDPINGKSSIAFYTEVKIKNSDDPTIIEDAFLLRVVPISNLEGKWTFPSSFEHLDVAVIDNSSNGEYIYHSAFSMTNFYEYYNKYNPLVQSALNEFKQKLSTEDGTFVMKDIIGRELFVAYSQIPDPDGHNKWTIITAIPMKDITNVKIDWLTISIIGIGLGILFVIDLTILLLLNKSLQETAKEAESANKAKTDFLSTMSHDIRTPMNAIVGLTHIASKEPKNPESTQDSLKKIALASNHLLTLINDILDISKVESGKLTLNPLSFSIVDTFENLVNISQPMVKAKNIDFSFRVHDFEHEWLYADKLRLSQIFTNLLSNALKYTEENGKVSVDIKELLSEKEGCIKLVYKVEDTGIGMSPEYIAKMYEPFTRATDSRINTIQGTGLGLAITKQMVDLMGGTIECQSEVGKGTAFTVTIDLPIDDKPNEEMVLPPIKVLVVDDDEVLLKTAEDTLNSLGVKTTTATTGKDALKLIEDNKDDQFKIVILDLKMPDMTGLEVANKINKIDHNDIPIILISAYDWSEIEGEARDAGINSFISKPLFRSKIYQKITDLLNHGESKSSDELDEMNFSGTKILVVEDNDINWEIISTILSMHEVSCDRAENGKIAYELIKADEFESPYDLIFMDIQMPVMNGLDATRAIRKLNSEYAKHVPIIAMTADAFSENVAECINVGMNGHLAKPIDLKLVLAEIRKVKKD